MQPEDWDSGFGRAIGVFLNGNGIRERDRRGETISDRHFFILFNGRFAAVPVVFGTGSLFAGSPRIVTGCR